MRCPVKSQAPSLAVPFTSGGQRCVEGRSQRRRTAVALILARAIASRRAKSTDMEPQQVPEASRRSGGERVAPMGGRAEAEAVQRRRARWPNPPHSEKKRNTRGSPQVKRCPGSTKWCSGVRAQRRTREAKSSEKPRAIGIVMSDEVERVGKEGTLAYPGRGLRRDWIRRE